MSGDKPATGQATAETAAPIGATPTLRRAVIIGLIANFSLHVLTGFARSPCTTVCSTCCSSSACSR